MPVKRILLAADAPDFSGVAFVARHLAVGLKRHGVEVRVWFQRPGPRLADYAGQNIAASVHPGFGLVGVGRKSAGDARAFAPDIVHAQSVAVAARARRLARMTGAAFLLTAHRLDLAENRRIVRYRDAGVVAVSDAIRERLINAAGLERDRVRVVPNALDLSLYPRPDFAVPDPDDLQNLPVVGACGRLEHGKGRAVFLRMAAKLNAWGVDAEYVLLGDGRERRELGALAEALGVRARVTFASMGDLSRIAHFDVLVEPSRIEGMGLSVLQAMALGVPVVAAGAGGMFSLVDDGVTGLLTRTDDPAGLAGAVKRLLDDPEGRTVMARQARDRVEARFDVGDVAGDALAFYRERRELTAGRG